MNSNTTTTEKPVKTATMKKRKLKTRDVQVRIVMYDYERESLNKYAEEQGVTVASLIRSRLFKNGKGTIRKQG